MHYIFVHDSVLEAVVCGETQVSASNFRLAMTKLGKVDPGTGLNGFELQHQVSPPLDTPNTQKMYIYQLYKIMYYS